MVAVPNEERERCAERAAVAQAGDHLDAVLLELLPGTSSVALLAAREIRVDLVLVELEPGRQAAEDPDERRAVRLARGCQPKRHEDKPTAPRIISTGAGIPVQSWKDAAPCATSTSRPLITSAPAARAATAVAVSGYGRSTRVCPSTSCDENVVSLGGRVHDQVRVAGFGWPVRIACEDACIG